MKYGGRLIDTPVPAFKVVTLTTVTTLKKHLPNWKKSGLRRRRDAPPWGKDPSQKDCVLIHLCA
jgi:hypothetical protein